MSGLIRDVRYALRQWRSAPGFTAFSLGVLAVGIGGSLALFGLFDALALRTLPVDRPDRLVAITTFSPAPPRDLGSLPLPALRAIEQRQRVFSAMAGYASGGVSTLDGGRPVEHGVAFTTPGYFETLGVQPVLGRLLTADDADDRVVVISDGHWQRSHNRDPNIIGQTIYLETIPFTIVGVAPKGFSGLQIASRIDFFAPIESIRAIFYRDLRAEDFVIPLTYAIGRLEHGVSIDQARSQLQAMWPAVLDDVMPPSAAGAERAELLSRRLDVVPASRGFSLMRDWYATPLQVLVVSTGLLLLILCVNLAGLVWARALSRQRDIDVRIAIGASPARIVRQLGVESLLLTTTGALLALPIAWVASQALVHMMWNEPAVLPLDLTPGWRVYVVAITGVAITGLAITFLPAWKTYRRTRAGRSSMLSGSIRVTSRANDALIVAQVAIAAVLLVGAGLVTSSLLTLRDRAGFPTESVQMSRLAPKIGAYAGQDLHGYMRDLVERAAAVPGVTSAALSVPEPLMGIEEGEERPPVTPADAPDGARIHATLMSVSPDFFATMRMALVGGRDFSWSDNADTRAVAVLSSRSAARLFPDGDAIGRTVRVGSDPRRQRMEVLGIVADARLSDLHADDPLFVFVSLLQQPDISPTVVIRTERRQAAIEPAIRQAIESAGRDFVTAQRSLDAQINVSLLRERLMAVGARWFGGLAVVLVAAGMAGVLSQFVARRTKEIGIRVALGASPAAIRTMVLGRTLRLIGMGLLIGLPLAGGAAAILASQLTAVSAADAATFALAISTILVVSIAAAWAPARRALGIKPIDALKAE